MGFFAKRSLWGSFSVEDGIKELIAALEQDLFSDKNFRRNFYGNHEIIFPLAKI